MTFTHHSSNISKAFANVMVQTSRNVKWGGRKFSIWPKKTSLDGSIHENEFSLFFRIQYYLLSHQIRKTLLNTVVTNFFQNDKKKRSLRMKFVYKHIVPHFNMYIRTDTMFTWKLFGHCDFIPGRLMQRSCKCINHLCTPELTWNTNPHLKAKPFHYLIMPFHVMCWVVLCWYSKWANGWTCL